MPKTPSTHDRRGNRTRRALVASVAWLAAFGTWTGIDSKADDVPTPQSHLGFRPGADSRLAPWGEVVSYFEKVDRASDRVRVRVLGESTEGRPFLAAFVSSPETIKDLDRYRG